VSASQAIPPLAPEPADTEQGARANRPARSRLRGERRLVAIIAPALIALAAAELVWTRLIMLPQGLWGDEAYSVFVYIRGGPDVIWSAARWIPNNHMLFEALTWATNGILGAHVEATDRLWSVIPAIAAAALMTWWLWRRIDRWEAAIFAVLATVAPLYFDLGVQARGYGLGFLAAALTLIAADRAARSAARSDFLLLGVGGFVGMATLQDFLPQFLGTAAVLFALCPAVRRRLVITVIGTGAVTLAWYAPVLSKILGYNNPYGVPLPWYGFITAPLRDLFGQSISSLDPSVSVTAGAIVAGVVLAAGIAELWRRRERRLAALLLVPVICTYLTIEVATGYLPRFVSFVMLDLLALAAIGLGGAGRQVFRSRRLVLPAAVVLVVCSGLALGRFFHYSTVYAQVPFEAAKTAGQIINGAQEAPGPVVTNHALTAFSDYISPHPVRTVGPAALVHMFCAYRGRFVYLEQELFGPYPDTACLTRRGSFRIALQERRSQVWLWMVPAITNP
jgi:hypothetical protein